MDSVHGPLGFCDLDKQGMLVEDSKNLVLLLQYTIIITEAHGSSRLCKDEWIEIDITMPRICC